MDSSTLTPVQADALRATVARMSDYVTRLRERCEAVGMAEDDMLLLHAVRHEERMRELVRVAEGAGKG